MNLTTSKTVSTKVQAKDEAGNECPAQKTELTINWDGCTPEDIQAMAQAALIVKLQGTWRKNGIPATTTVKASDHKVGVRAPAVKQSLEDMIAALSPADRAAFIAKVQASLN